jgi:hypothetical protein
MLRRRHYAKRFAAENRVMTLLEPRNPDDPIRKATVWTLRLTALAASVFALVVLIYLAGLLG